MKAFIKGTLEEFTVGLQYNPENGKLVIGGNICFQDKIQSIIADYFQIDFAIVKAKVVNRNKIKYEMKIDFIKFSEAINLMKKDNVIVNPTNNLDRIWW